MKITAGQPPAGAAPSGSVSVAASAVPSADVMFTSCVENARAGPEATSAVATAASRKSNTRAAGAVTAARVAHVCKASVCGDARIIRAMDARPIGVFDSGVGGLTVLHELLVTLPHEDAVYLGDNARLPYGPRPLADVRRFALEVGRHLEKEGVKLVVVACNTATAAGLPDLLLALAVPTALRAEVALVAVGGEVAQLRVGDHHDVTPAAPVAPVGPAARDVRFAAEAHAAVAAVAGQDLDVDFVYEHERSCGRAAVPDPSTWFRRVRC